MEKWRGEFHRKHSRTHKKPAQVWTCNISTIAVVW